MKKQNTGKILIKDTSKSELNFTDSDFASAILHNTSDAITAINLKGEILFWNNGASVLSGYSKEEVMGKHISLVYRKQDIPALTERIKKAFQGENFANKELILVDKNKKEHTVLLSLNGLKDESGKVIQLVGFTKDITELNKSKIELIEVKEKAEQVEQKLISQFESALFNISDGFVSLDTNWCYTYINKKAAEFLGRFQEELIGKHIWTEFPEGVGLPFYHAYYKAVDTQETICFEEYYEPFNKWFENRIYPSSDGLVIYFTDITEKKLSEIAFKESEERFHQAFDNSPIPISILNLNTGKRLAVNKSFTDTFGYTESELLNEENIHKVNIAVSQKVFKTTVKKILEQGTIFEYPFQMYSKSGEIRDVLLNATKAYDDNKDLFITSYLDITDRKQAEAELINAKENAEKSERYLDNIINNIGDPFFVKDEQSRLLLVNDAFCSIFDLKRENIIGKTLAEDVSPEERESFLKIDRQVLKTGKEDIIEEELTVRGAETKTIYTRKTRYIDTSGKKYLIGVIRDITKRKNAEKELATALDQVTELKQQIEAENIYLKEELKLDDSFNEIVGSSKPVKKMLKQVQQVAKTNTSVLVLGETGTGKELIARAIHNASDRKDKPLVKVNCSALPAELIESEFFGHEAGAFTSAVARKIGRFELANGGTIFLDEIGDLPLGLQTRLLRVLQESEFERVGGEHTIKVNVRVITATNRNLEKEVKDGNFRQDLYYRLNVFPITCPSLRERIDDVPSLVNHFVNKYNHKLNKHIKTINQKTMDRFMKYKWPGNIRELEHVIERAVILNQGGQLRLGNWFMDKGLDNVVSDDLKTLETVERDYILKVLEKTNWKIRGKNGAADILGMKPTTLESRMKKWNITR